MSSQNWEFKVGGEEGGMIGDLFWMTEWDSGKLLLGVKLDDFLDLDIFR